MRPPLSAQEAELDAAAAAVAAKTAELLQQALQLDERAAELKQSTEREEELKRAIASEAAKVAALETDCTALREREAKLAAQTRGQWRALIDCYGRHRRPVARAN